MPPEMFEKSHRPLSPQAYFPHAVEPALGVNRLLLGAFCSCLRQELLPTTIPVLPHIVCSDAF